MFQEATKSLNEKMIVFLTDILEYTTFTNIL